MRWVVVSIGSSSEHDIEVYHMRSDGKSLHLICYYAFIAEYVAKTDTSVQPITIPASNFTQLLCGAVTLYLKLSPMHKLYTVCTCI